MENLLVKNPFVLFQGFGAFKKIPEIIKLINTIDNKTSFVYSCKKDEKEVFENYFDDVFKKEHNKFSCLAEEEIINLMLKKNSKLPSVLLLSNLEDNSVNNYIIMNLWLYVYQNRESAPLLLMFSNNESIIDTPFEFNKNNTYYVKDYLYNKKNIIYYEKDIFYKNYEELIKKLSQNIIYYHENIKSTKNSSWLVFLSSKKECNKLYYNIKKSIKEAEIIMINNETEKNIIDNINNNYRNRKIIITCIYRLDIQNVDAVFDSMIGCNICENSSENKFNTVEYITKNESKIRCNYINNFHNKNFCLRMCKEKFFNTLYLYKVPEMIKFSLLETYLTIKKNKDIDISSFYPAIEKEKLARIESKLINLSLLTKNSLITKKGKEVLDINNLSIKNALFILLWREKKLPLFPGIIVACIIENFSYNYTYDFVNNKLEYLLEMCKNYYKEIKTLHTEKKVFKDYCNMNNISFQHFKNLLNLIKETCIEMYNYNNFELGLYDIENVVKESIPIISRIYYDQIIELEDNDLNNFNYLDIYANINTLDVKFENKYFDFPQVAVVIDGKKCNKEQKYIVKNMITIV